MREDILRDPQDSGPAGSQGSLLSEQYPEESPLQLTVHTVGLGTLALAVCAGHLSVSAGPEPTEPYPTATRGPMGAFVVAVLAAPVERAWWESPALSALS